MPDRTFRLIVDPPRPAALNMAVDEMLMRGQREPGSEPTLRVYFWERPSVSLGYFQKIDEAARHAWSGPVDVVRRLTGGGAVRHGEDLTFSLTLTDPNPFFKGDVRSSYLAVHEPVRSGLRRLFPDLDFADCKDLPAARGRGFSCFDRLACYDLVQGGKKVLGSSQRRTAGAVLHQSSLLLQAERGDLLQAIVSGFEEKWGVRFEAKPLSAVELGRAGEIETERYGGAEWGRSFARRTSLARSFFSKHSGQLYNGLARVRS